jgi:hypothetical protein
MQSTTTGLAPLREKLQQQHGHSRASSAVLQRESTSDGNMIGRAVSRYSKHASVGLEWNLEGPVNKENTGWTVKSPSARTTDSGTLAFV